MKPWDSSTFRDIAEKERARPVSRKGPWVRRQTRRIGIMKPKGMEGVMN